MVRQVLFDPVRNACLFPACLHAVFPFSRIYKRTLLFYNETIFFTAPGQQADIRVPQQRKSIPMEGLRLYRKRIIPEECVFLKDDIILQRDSDVIITKWKTLHPKKTLSHGYSCYFLERGFKVSKFYDHEDQLISWYCDIIQTEKTSADGVDTYTFTDLLADVVVYPDGRVRVVDLDELADAQRDHLITPEELQAALRHLDRLLTIIYRGSFDTLQKYVNAAEEKDRALS